MQSLKSIPIVAVMAVAFCLSFGVLWWKNNSTAGQSDLAPVVIPDPVATATNTVLPLPVAPAAAPQGVALAVNSPRPIPAQPVEVNDNGEELPVIVAFRHGPDFFRDRSTNFVSVRKIVNEGIVSSDDVALTITVIDIDPQTQEVSETTLDLAKGGEKHFGMHEGLPMSKGDQLLLRCAPYRDLVRTIP